MGFAYSIGKAVKDGKTGVQFAIPDGKFVGDLYFITNEKNEIIIIFAWNGDRWMSEHDCKMDVEIQKNNLVGLGTPFSEREI